MSVRHLVLLGLFVGLTLPVVATKKSATDASPTLKEVLEDAKKDGKLAFILLGRGTCGNCQALREYIAKGTVRLPRDRFVYADLNLDDPATMQAFAKAFKVDGNTLPFVVIAGSNGRQLASRTGFGSPAQYTTFIHDAEKLAPKTDKVAVAKNGLPKKNRRPGRRTARRQPGDTHLDLCDERRNGQGRARGGNRRRRGPQKGGRCQSRHRPRATHPGRPGVHRQDP